MKENAISLDVEYTWHSFLELDSTFQAIIITAVKRFSLDFNHKVSRITGVAYATMFLRNYLFLYGNR